ncbi:MAG: 2-C-methyl-D-erythritol 4-phosphate cytidylyltransferase [Candidatus Omnitrophica bacterium CG11_big_fil_rev_8_21_14_0_20_63_9]|nr:MAG: 2-C-methyl-D-erythritol 4-phosphate cytidylyltransferase [Candidatus Omnitrophica bacterium CG11_big_fil_rev_8_21_14_0_20_63_9]
MSVVAVVPAAGVGARFNGASNKPFVELQGVPMLAHVLQALQAAPSVRWIVVAVRSEQLRAAQALITRYHLTKVLPPCEGGASRAASVANGFAAAPGEAQWVLVHDAARPCVRPQLIEETIRAAQCDGSAVCGLPASVTVKAVDDEREVRLTLDREHLWFIQTPQVFRREWFAQALARAQDRLDQFPDDAAMVEWAGFRVRVVDGDPLNIKVTTPEDLMLAEAILGYRARGQKSEVGHQKKSGKRRTRSVLV